MPEQIVVCSSGGKDSCLSLYALQQQGEYDVTGLLTTVTADYDRVSMHGVRRSLLRDHAAALGLPLHEVEISRAARNAEYELKMGAALEMLRGKGVSAIGFGDIFLEDLREYRERLTSRHNVQAVFPLWQRDSRELAEEFIQQGFRARIVCVDPKVLDASFVGRILDRDFLDDLPVGVDPCGENGEFHTFVFDGPNFSRKVPSVLGETVLRDSFLYSDLVREDRMPRSTAANTPAVVAPPSEETKPCFDRKA